MNFTPRVFVFAAVAVAYVFGDNEVTFTDCGSKVGVIESVAIVPCPGAPAGCQLKKNTTPVLQMKFHPTETVTGVSVKVWGIIAGIPIPFPLPNDNGCEDAGLTCPLAPNQSQTYHVGINVKSIYPSIPLVIKLQMTDQDGQTIGCFQIRASIVS